MAEVDNFDTKIEEYLSGDCIDGYQLFGSKPEENGTSFTLYAPNAASVWVAGDFNCWSADANPMQKDRNGVWHVFISGVAVGALYRYVIEDREGNRIYKSDPYALYSELRPGTASVVYPILSYPWSDQDWCEYRQERTPITEPMNIYEIHLGSWRRGKPSDGSEGETELSKAEEPFLNYREIAELLVVYLEEMHYTHVEIMPVCEHPLDGSWGYQTLSYYSITSRFGTPEDFRYFVNRLHTAGFGVILDWVPGHFCKDSPGLYYFDGSWLYENKKAVIRENYQWGTANFDLGKGHVQSFLLSNAVYFMKEFHIDGIRVDAVANMLYLDYAKGSSKELRNQYGGRECIEGIEFLRKLNQTLYRIFSNPVMIAEESSAWPLVTKPTYIGGLGFTFKWNMGWMNDSLDYAGTDPLFKKWKHNKLTFSLMYAFSENYVLPLSHDEVVHGKCSMLSKMPGDYENKFGALRCFYTYMMGHPGKKLLFMGGEFGQFIEWRYYEELEWKLLLYPAHRKLKDYVSQLNYYYKTLKPFWERDDGYEGFQWIDADNGDQSIVSFIRRSHDEQDFLIFICNFTPVKYENYRIGVPRFCDYKELLNSDHTMFGGAGILNDEVIKPEAVGMHGQPASVVLRIPANGAMILKPEFRQRPLRRTVPSRGINRKRIGDGDYI